MNEIINTIEKTRERFIACCPDSMMFEAEKGFAIQHLNNNSYLAAAAISEPASLAQSITNVATVGLSLNPVEKLAFLVPRNVKDAAGKFTTKVFLDPSYVGLIRLATNSGSIEWAAANIVRENDTFIDHGPGEKPTHDYEVFGKDRGEIVGAFCTAKTPQGDYLTTAMAIEQIHAVRDRSELWKQYKSGPWADFPIEMIKKVLVKNAFKMWPRTDERAMQRMAMAVHVSNENEGFEPIATAPQLNQYTDEQKTHFDYLLSNSDGFGLWVFREGIEESAFNNLYHSFEKGKKGQYQRLVDDLYKAGVESANQYIADIEALAESDDNAGMRQMAEELAGYALAVDALDVIAGRLSAAAALMLKGFRDEKEN